MKSRDEQILNLRHLIPIKIEEVIFIVGEPDLVCDDMHRGMVVYFLEQNQEGVIICDVLDGMLTTFAGMTRHKNNAQRPDGSTFNFLDYMEKFSGSQMQRSLENLTHSGPNESPA